MRFGGWLRGPLIRGMGFGESRKPLSLVMGAGGVVWLSWGKGQCDDVC